MKKRLKVLCAILLFVLVLASVPAKANAAVRLNKTSITVNVGKTFTLKALGTKSNISWKSSNKAIATVSSKGIVKGIKKGICSITAIYGKKKLTCKVTVKQPVKKITLNRTSVSINKASTVKLKATVTPITANNKSISWTSSNTSIAKVSSTGTVTGIAKGKATITAKAKDGSGIKAICTVTVKQPVTSISLNKNKLSLAKGKSVSLRATVYPKTANDKSVNWKSSNKAVAKVSSSGYVTAVSNGTATITVRSASNARIKATCLVTVTDYTPITNLAELKAALKSSDYNSANEKYKIMKDIDMSALKTTIECDYYARSIIDGNNHTLYNLNVPLVDKNNATIKNIHFENVNIKSKKSQCGAVAGENGFYGKIINCTVAGIIELNNGDSGYVGGICGENRGTISGCTNKSVIKGNAASISPLGDSVPGHYINVGGICGENLKEMVSCHNIGAITATNSECSYMGGICGENWGGTVTSCYNNGSVTSINSEGAYVGGICGFQWADSDVIKCYNKGEIEAKNSERVSVGGICGYNSNSTVENCYNFGNINGQAQDWSRYFGGLVGHNSDGNIYTSYNLGPCQNGLVGYIYDGYIVDCYYCTDTSDNAIGNDYDKSHARFYGLTKNQMQSQNSFTAFDFNNVWKMATYPVLR